jgi:predicted dehydrogenase
VTAVKNGPTAAKLRLGLIGVGKHGQRYARHIREDFSDSLELVAIARRDHARAAETASALGCRHYGDYRELIAAPDVDAVIAVVPPSLHLGVVSAAARARRPLLLEKPAAVSVATGRLMLAELDAHPVPVMVAHTLRYNAVVRTLLAQRAAIGAIHSISLSQRFEPSVLPWIDDPAQAGGGITLHTGVHSFDLLRVVTGSEADRVTCQLQAVCTRQTEDGFAAGIRFAGGQILATVSGARTARGRTGHIEVAGEQGTLVGDHVLHYAYLVRGTEKQPLETGPPAATVRETLRDFATAVRAGTPVPIPLSEGLRAVALAEACYLSDRSGIAAPVEAI